MDNESKARLAELESQLAFQEDTLQTLNDIVARQEQQIEKLTARLEQIFAQVHTLNEHFIERVVDDKPPPHY